MATVTVILSRATSKYNGGPDRMPIADAVYDEQEDITSSASSQQTTIVADSNQQSWTIQSNGGDVRVVAGADPTATTATGWLVADGTTLQLGADILQKLAVIDAV